MSMDIILSSDLPNLGKKAKKAKHRSNIPDGHSKSSSDQVASKQELIARSEPEYVQYLRLFNTNKQAWKFNKNKQSDLFKNVFNIYRVPSEHTPALLQYLEGLQGAAACKHLIDRATEVLQEVASQAGGVDDMSGLESEQARRDAYRDALRRRAQGFPGRDHGGSAGGTRRSPGRARSGAGSARRRACAPSPSCPEPWSQPCSTRS